MIQYYHDIRILWKFLRMGVHQVNRWWFSMTKLFLGINVLRHITFWMYCDVNSMPYAQIVTPRWSSILILCVFKCFYLICWRFLVACVSQSSSSAGGRLIGGFVGSGSTRSTTRSTLGPPAGGAPGGGAPPPGGAPGGGGGKSSETQSRKIVPRMNAHGITLEARMRGCWRACRTPSPSLVQSFHHRVVGPTRPSHAFYHCSDLQLSSTGATSWFLWRLW